MCLFISSLQKGLRKLGNLLERNSLHVGKAKLVLKGCGEERLILVRTELGMALIYSVILGFLRDPMRFFVPPHQNFYERYTAEHYYYKH